MRVVLSGGGTAGHINPALALAEELSALEAEIRERYFALTQKPLIAALKDAANRYRAVEEKGR